MKVTLPLAALLIASSVPAVQAQNEFSIANHTGDCPKCSAKDQKILNLQTEIAALKGESSDATEAVTEAVPITPVEESTAKAPAHTGPMYTVQPGDGLMKIARKTNCKAADIAAANDMALDAIIHPGQILKLPTAATVAAAPAAKAVEEAPKATKATQPKTYTIKEGETYYRISRNLKIPLDELMAANPKIPANRLYAGRKIKLPVEGAVPAPAETATAPAPEITPETSPETTSNETDTIKETTIEEVASDLPPSDPPPLDEKKIVAVSVEQEISYGDFAAKHGTTTERLNSLNDLNLTGATILAKGSELYVPASVQTAAN